MEFIELIGRNFPKSITEKVKRMLGTAGSNYNPYVFSVIIAAISLTLLLATTIFSLTNVEINALLEETAFQLFPQLGGPLKVFLAILFSLLVVSLFLVLLSSYYAMKADARRNAIEQIFPDFLALVSSNVRSGMTLEQALWNAAKPEFGILAKEVRTAIKQSFSGEPIDKSLDYLASRFNSPVLRRAINIIKNSIYSGGEIAKVLDKIAEESSELLVIKKEIRSSLIIYVIFLFFASALGIPFMLAVSQKLLVIIEESFNLIDVSTIPENQLPFNVGKPPITSSQFYYFSIIMILISTLTSSFMIGATYSGKKSDGIKYFPIILVLSFIVFFTAGYLLESFFSSILGRA